MTSKYRWVSEAVVLALHDEQIAEHGGATGLRDIGLLRSALARPQNLLAYGKPEVAELAAAYAFGIIRDHPFLDGNKRTAYVVAAVFLLDNGDHAISASDAEALTTMLALADGSLGEKTFAAWLRANLDPRL